MKNVWVVLEISKEQYTFLKNRFGGYIFFREDNGKHYIRLLQSVKNKLFPNG